MSKRGCDRRDFLRAMGVSACGIFAGQRLWAQTAEKKAPNIILILADDLGWVDTGATGSRLYPTPNMKRLAERAMYFPNAYSASPLCSPTRASIMTGQSPARTGFTSPSGHVGKEVLEASVQEKAPPTNRQRITVSVTRLATEYYTLGEAMKDAGYATAHFGKWHLGAEPYSPLEHGFDVDMPHWPGPGPAGSFVAPWKFPDFEPRTPGEHIEDRMADEAAAWMKEHQSEPFFLNYWQFSVHAPFNAKEELIEDYRERIDPEDPQRSPTYAAMVHSLDDAVGKLLDTVDELGIADNTIIIFYSDNGGNMYDLVDGTTATSNKPLRGGKASIYEGGIRVPAFVVWPGVVEGGSRNKTLVQSEDLYPTILELSGATPKQDQPVDGLSMIPALRGNEPTRDAVYCYFPHAPAVPDWMPPSVCVIKERWKLIRIFHDDPQGNGHRYELYNLQKDIGEQHNLADKRTKKVRELDALIEDFLAETNAVQPQPNPAYDPNALHNVHGWQALAGGAAIIGDNKRLGALQFRAFGPDAAMSTEDEVDLPEGDYTVVVDMLALGQGKGRITGLGESGEEAASAAFDVQHDRKWHEYRVKLAVDKPIKTLVLQPSEDSGTMQIRGIRIEGDTGAIVKNWSFAPEGTAG